VIGFSWLHAKQLNPGRVDRELNVLSFTKFVMSVTHWAHATKPANHPMVLEHRTEYPSLPRS
jgi:hypothetical protein